MTGTRGMIEVPCDSEGRRLERSPSTGSTRKPGTFAWLPSRSRFAARTSAATRRLVASLAGWEFEVTEARGPADHLFSGSGRAVDGDAGSGACGNDRAGAARTAAAFSRATCASRFPPTMV